MPALVRGIIGQVKWSYYNAAAIHGYAVSRSEQGQWSLRASVVMADAFKLSQRPLVFVAPTQRGDMRWPITDLNLSEGVLVANLGPPEE
jgi:hypothetical protein